MICVEYTALYAWVLQNRVYNGLENNRKDKSGEESRVKEVRILMKTKQIAIGSY